MKQMKRTRMVIYLVPHKKTIPVVSNTYGWLIPADNYRTDYQEDENKGMMVPVGYAIVRLYCTVE